MSFKPLLKLLRITHWIKNSIIFFPLFFSGSITKIPQETLLYVVLTFFAFCFTSSCIYILNDLKDAEIDRLHPQKKNRPIASNLITHKQAKILFILILLIAIAFMLPLKPIVIAIIICYFILNIAYTYIIKNIALIDVTSISLGFVLRLLAGGIMAGVIVTHWIIITTFLLMFSVALAKRRDDLVISKTSKEFYRQSQAGYNLQFIDTAMAISFGATIVFYISYCVSPDVINRLGSQHIYITALPVILGVFRYLQLALVEKKTGSPVKLLYSDVLLKVLLFIWLVLFYFLIYV